LAAAGKQRADEGGWDHHRGIEAAGQREELQATEIIIGKALIGSGATA
jgi:hypothetical protein